MANVVGPNVMQSAAGEARPQVPNGSLVDTTATIASGKDTEQGDSWQAKVILSLDGGGTRGFWQLLLLNEVMERVKRIETTTPGPQHHSSFYTPSQDDEAPSEDPMCPLTGFHLCHYVDYMFGTSTGGLNAIKLGRLRMNPSECIEKYPQMAAAIFGSPRNMSWKGLLRPRYHSSKLESQFQKLVNEHKPLESNTDERFSRYPCPRDLCRTVVVSKQIGNTEDSDEVYIFRTYNHESGSSLVYNPGVADNHYIWQVARATSAAPGYFSEIKIGDMFYADGALGYNNPAQIALDEVAAVEGYGRKARSGKPRRYPVKVLVSVGCGNKPRGVKRVQQRLPRLSNLEPVRKVLNYAARFRGTLTDVEKVDKDIQRLNETKGFEYHRFQAPPAVGELKLDDWKPRRGSKPSTEDFMRAKFDDYVQEGETSERLDALAQSLVETRRSRIGENEARWRRFTRCTTHVCGICKHDTGLLEDLRVHIQRKHPDELSEDVDDLIENSEKHPRSARGPH